MRKFWIVLLIAVLLIPQALAGEEGGTQQQVTVDIDLIASNALVHTVGAGTFTQTPEHRIIANNRKLRNTALMSEIFLVPGSTIAIQIKAIIKEGNAFGIIIGEKDYVDPLLSGFICLNADNYLKTSRLFAYHGPGQEQVGDGKVFLEDKKMAEGQEITLRMDIDPDGRFWTSYNGIEYSNGTLHYEGFAGGYVGIMTYESDVEFLSATMSVIQDVAPSAPKLIDLIGSRALQYHVGDGAFFYTDAGHIAADNVNLGDTAVMSDIFLEPGRNYSINVNALLKNGKACGIIIGEKDFTDPLATGWICANADTALQTSRLFAYQGPAAEVIGDGKAFVKDPELSPGKEVSLQLDITRGGFFRVYYNGMEYTGGEIHYPGFAGGYVGIMTFFADVDFLTATLSIIE